MSRRILNLVLQIIMVICLFLVIILLFSTRFQIISDTPVFQQELVKSDLEIELTAKKSQYGALLIKYNQYLNKADQLEISDLERKERKKQISFYFKENRLPDLEKEIENIQEKLKSID